MNDFPVIGDLVIRTGLWDRQGANSASISLLKTHDLTPRTKKIQIWRHDGKNVWYNYRKRKYQISVCTKIGRIAMVFQSAAGEVQFSKYARKQEFWRNFVHKRTLEQVQSIL